MHLKNSTRWFFMQYFQNLAWNISSLFLSIFIWQQTRNIDFLYKYYLALFIALPIAGIVSALISSRLSFKVDFVISFLGNAVLLYLASKWPVFFLTYPVYFGLVNGLSNGLYYVATDSSRQSMFSDNVAGITAKFTSASNLNSLLVPLLGSFAVLYLNSYNIVFMAGVICLIIATLIALMIDFSRKKMESGQVEKLTLPEVISDGDFKKYFIFSLIWGVKSGIEWSVFGVVVLNLVGGKIGSWGIINFFVAVAGIVSGLIYSAYFAGKKDPIALILSSILYTVLGVFLLADFNLTSFIMYFIGSSVTSTFIGSSTTKLSGDVYKRLTDRGNISEERYFSILEFPLAIGRVIPIIILFATHSQLEGNNVLVALFFIVSTIPLICTFIFQYMKSFNREVIWGA